MAQAAQVITEAPGNCQVEPVVRAVLADVPGPEQLRRRTDVAAGLEVGVAADVLARILTPLVGNGARYAGTTVTVHGARVGGRVQIQVRDDGPGVSPEFADRVFDPGARADSGDGHPGAGLGLALARRLARAAGGDISLEGASASGSGATFAVVLPPG
jgi:two-component system heavy metal sensor histidine kinase CusS